MRSSTTSVSNSMLLTFKEWFIIVILLFAVSITVYFGWYYWERFEPGKDYRNTCWAERMSDYWAYTRWCRYAREHFDVLLMGDSVIWGQEVRYDQTISHYLNEFLGEEVIVNLGIDGLHMAGINGIVTHYGRYLQDTGIILQFNPLWMSSERRDLRGEGKISYHHPRLIPQLSPRINYNQELPVRLGYLFDHFFRLSVFVRHIMVNYFENKSISSWMIDNPYSCPFDQITFEATPVMEEKQGKGLDWEEKGYKQSKAPFVPIKESIQWKLYIKALKKLEKRNVKIFILIGPYNSHMHTTESREKLRAMLNEVKAALDEMGYLYFDSVENNLPSKTFADSCHLLAEGHSILAQRLLNDPGFHWWLNSIRN